MIGKITSTIPEWGDVMLTLNEEGMLECNSPLLLKLAEMRLNIYRQSYSPASGPFGVSFLNQLAKDLSGEVEMEHKKEPPHHQGEVVY